MSNIIIKKEEKNTYQIKIYECINIYNMNELKEIIGKIIKKIRRKNKLRNQILLDIYPNKFETIIILKDYNKITHISNITEVKINIHTDTEFLYEIDYLNINKNLKGTIYYYKNKFYLKIKNISKKEYLYLTEHSLLIIYKNNNKILENGLKIKI